MPGRSPAEPRNFPPRHRFSAYEFGWAGASAADVAIYLLGLAEMTGVDLQDQI
jgi:hypothetical protein